MGQNCHVGDGGVEVVLGVHHGEVGGGVGVGEEFEVGFHAAGFEPGLDACAAGVVSSGGEKFDGEYCGGWRSKATTC